MRSNGAASDAGKSELAAMPSPSIIPGITNLGSMFPALMGPLVMPRTLASPTVLVFDSGLGGLTVYRELVEARPDARYVYAADDALFPYGNLKPSQLIARVTAVIGSLIEAHHPDLVVVACNTASTLVLPALRARFSIPFVGTVPAIKPACAASSSKLVSVLGTNATVTREYTQALIREFASGCAVTLVGSSHLARYAEAELGDGPVADALILAEIAPCFVEEDARRTDVVVLACTHYPLLIERLKRLAPWPVAFLDPAPAIARRVVDLIGQAESSRPASGCAVFTSERSFSPKFAAALASFGIKDLSVLAVENGR
jgi:glutamate racemase